MENYKACYKCAVLLALICLVDGRALNSKNKQASTLSAIGGLYEDHFVAENGRTVLLAESKRSSFGHSKIAKNEGFRPTTPGNSPGVGHSHEEGGDKGFINGGTIGKTVSVSGLKDDFRPTSPGHSPGVGHVRRNTNGDPNA